MGLPWTEEDDRKLIEGRNLGLTHEYISERRHSRAACVSRYMGLKRRFAEDQAEAAAGASTSSGDNGISAPSANVGHDDGNNPAMRYATTSGGLIGHYNYGGAGISSGGATHGYATGCITDAETTTRGTANGPSAELVAGTTAGSVAEHVTGSASGFIAELAAGGTANWEGFDTGTSNTAQDEIPAYYLDPYYTDPSLFSIETATNINWSDFET
ncbi:hypothetical protein B0T16DRAFT_384974 [Cercophora newfieldiana]|uniref:Myb-like domain-containing protein n=1 Tax=Cercophora newfieldiana TaxID=92897 RepID=A0AA39YQV5_9PEZI|nr:hypothetical protein B0T16DRAFT_384974 [Cercophora newfieldiana]